MTRRFALFPWRSRRDIAHDVDTELAFHLEMRVTELVAGGLDAPLARAQAEAEFGDLEFTRRYCRTIDAQTDRATRMTDRLAAWGQDLRYALRSLRKAPGFALVSLLTLMLAIGANTAIYTVTRAVLLRPLPYGSPDALMALFSSWPGHPYPAFHTPLSPPDFVDVQAQQKSFSSVAAYNGGSMTWLPTSGDPEIVSTMSVSANMFTVLQVKPAYGRAFVPGDDSVGSVPRVMVSWAFWQRALGGDVSSVNRQITLDGKRYDLIGVMPKGFTLWNNEDMWVPLDLSGELANAAVTRKQHWVHAIGRLKPGITMTAANAELQAIAHGLAVTYPTADSGRTTFSMTYRDLNSGDFRPALLLLLGGAGLVLLIACANLANLTLSRTTARRREVAVRAALGAGRGRIMRQLLIESTLVAVLGGALGVALATVVTRVLLALNTDLLPGIFVVGVDAPVVLFSLALSLATGIGFGLLPALDAGATDLNTALREGGRGSGGGRSGVRVRRALVVAQIGLAVMLLIGAGLLIRSFRDITQTPLGYDPSHVLTAQVSLRSERYDSEPRVIQFYDRVIGDLSKLPGVLAVGAASNVPTQGQVGTSLRIEGEPVNDANLPDISYVSVSGEYFKAMAMPLRAGRAYTASDDASKDKVVILNEIAATRFFPKGDAIGRRIRIGPRPDGPWMTIIGVVGNINDNGSVVAPQPVLYANHRQEAWQSSLTFVVRTAGRPETAIPLLRRAVTTEDRSVALRNLVSMEQLLGSSLATRRFSLVLLACFSAIALLLAAVGIYGVLAYSVSSRTREFGLRLALGATPGSVRRLVIRQGLSWALIGLAVGICGAVAGGRLLASMLYGVGPVDMSTYVSVAAGLLAVVLAASAIPAVRATRVDPSTSMRAE